MSGSPLPEGPFLAGRVVLVTGSAKRLGRAIALATGALGARVAVHYRGSAPEALATAEAIREAGCEAEVFQADLTRPDDCARLVAAVTARFGALHVLVNNVGDYLEKDVLGLEIPEWHGILDSSLNSVFCMCHHALPVIRKQDYGRVVNIGYATTGQVVANPLATPYAIAKNGVLTLTKSLAVSLGAEPVTVNMVSPGVLAESVTYPPIAEVPKHRWGRPEELAGAVCYLLSEQAAYVTGQHIEVAGGWGL